MNKALENLKEYCKRQGYGTTDDDLYEILQEGTIVYSEVYDSRRWWDVTENVTEIEGVLYMWEDASTTGDNTPKECGWEFNVDDIRFAEKVVETKEVISYRQRKEEEE